MCRSLCPISSFSRSVPSPTNRFSPYPFYPHHRYFPALSSSPSPYSGAPLLSHFPPAHFPLSFPLERSVSPGPLPSPSSPITMERNESYRDSE